MSQEIIEPDVAPEDATQPTGDPMPEQTDNQPRPEDGEQNVSQDPDVDLSVASVVDEIGES